MWLAERHDSAPAEERQALHLLGGRIMTLRCGHDPSSAEEVLAAEAEAEEAVNAGVLDAANELQAAGGGITKWQASRELILLERVRVADEGWARMIDRALRYTPTIRRPSTSRVWSVRRVTLHSSISRAATRWTRSPCCSCRRVLRQLMSLCDLGGLCERDGLRLA